MKRDGTREDRIRQRAYALWEREGRPAGQEGRHWAEAEKQEIEADSIAAGQPSKAPDHEPRNR